MERIYKRKQIIGTSWCDSSSRLSVTGCFALFLDTAGEHAEDLGCGVELYRERGLFWVASKTAVRFYRRPALWEKVEVSTWPEPPKGLRSLRDYRLTAGDEVLAEGKTEFVLVELETGRMLSSAGLYSPDFPFSGEKAVPGAFHRFTEGTPWVPFSEYTVRATDIDLGGHMNNVAYVRMLERRFSTREWTDLGPASLELHYRASCYEGDRLTLFRRDTAEGLELRAEKNDGNLILLALLGR